MKNKKIKIIKTLFVTLIICINIFLILPSKSIAIPDVTENPDIWNPTTPGTSGSMGTKIAPVLGMIRFVGIIISVITLSVIGLKIMYGSVEEKAKYKETLMPWAIGAFMLFSMTTLPDLIYNFAADKPVGGSDAQAKDGGYAQRVDVCAGGNVMPCTQTDCICKSQTFYVASGTYQCSKCGLVLGDKNYCIRCSQFREIKIEYIKQDISKDFICTNRMEN